MYVSQHDVAQIQTAHLKLLALEAKKHENDKRVGPLWRAFKVALVRAVQERERLERYAEAEVELAFDDEEGELLPEID